MDHLSILLGVIGIITSSIIGGWQIWLGSTSNNKMKTAIAAFVTTTSVGTIGVIAWQNKDIPKPYTDRIPVGSHGLSLIPPSEWEPLRTKDIDRHPWPINEDLLLKNYGKEIGKGYAYIIIDSYTIAGFYEKNYKKEEILKRFKAKTRLEALAKINIYVSEEYPQDIANEFAEIEKQNIGKNDKIGRELLGFTNKYRVKNKKLHSSGFSFQSSGDNGNILYSIKLVIVKGGVVHIVDAISELKHKNILRESVSKLSGSMRVDTWHTKSPQAAK